MEDTSPFDDQSDELPGQFYTCFQEEEVVLEMVEARRDDRVTASCSSEDNYKG